MLVQMNFSYFFIFFITLVAIVFAVINIIVPLILSPRDWEEKDERLKIFKFWRNYPYESGEINPLPARFQYNIHYYMYAILFVIFDIEVLFFIPWVITLQKIGWITVIEMLVFVAILLVGLYYAILRDGLKWR
ncbi:MAG: NADH-quinone oxidoreductase subunit A [Candidatus Calescibacterium sp.]|nr:NADH-quinone oxidoreductase subunit A [Candidatus Calescibacterium sp.]MCX7972013.1 NADH-quinone oxidoreductase subunit A [bacterium]MDW8194703.1 NADH-quinone oxidoreductase subunit A [Candidatus Calescibacterium sp.]